MTRLCSCIPRWPLIVITLCLLLLSFLAPHSWYVRYSTISDHPATSGPGSGSELVSTGLRDAAHVAITGDTKVASRGPANRKKKAPGKDDLAAHLRALGDFEAPQRPADVSPPIAERILLDPSISETPPIPAPYGAIITNKVQTSTIDPERLDAENHERIVAEARRDLLRRTEMPLPTTMWPYPQPLVEDLKSLQSDPVTSRWATEAIREVERLKLVKTLSDPEVGSVLERLDELTTQPKDFAADTKDFETRAQLLRANYAIIRRLKVWDEVYALATSTVVAPAPVLDTHEFQKLLKSTDKRLQEIGNAAAWRDYLLLPEAQNLTSPKTGVDADRFRAVARRMLLRMDAPSLSEQQFSFFRESPFPELELELRRWASEPVDYRKLLVDIERYEVSLATVDAQRVANYYQILRWSPDEKVVKLADQMNTYFRNANVRVAISSELINHLLPGTSTMYEDVNDVILGAQVTGRSSAATRLGVVLMPDRRQWRLGLLANGEAVSDTESYKSGASFRNDGRANYQARKLVLVDRRGVKVGNAETSASVQSSLRHFQTDYDNIPLLSMIARSIARNQYEEKSSQAQAEMKDRVAWRASARFDQEVQAKFEKAEKDFKEKLLKPLQELELQPTAVDMETTETRLIVRERLAGKDQLGAHTPRPQAPGHSWLSVQVHESAMNNALAHLGLDGKRTDLPTLYREITHRFENGNASVPEDLPEDVIIQFANEESVRVHCEKGRVTLTIRIVELSQGRGNSWKNFVVRAHYKPLVDQSVANLARDGVIELVGERLGFGDQVKLRGVFSKILSRNSHIAVINKKLAESERLAHLRVCQFVVDDGWIGVALEPGARTTRKPAAGDNAK